MRKRFAFTLSLWVVLCGTQGLAQSKGEAPGSQLHVRLEGSPVYKEGTTVALASALLKRHGFRNADGSGSLAAVLLLTNHPGFGCEADPDMPLASEREFIIGISLYEAFAAGEGPEKTVLHQMLFSAPKTLDQNQPVVFQWKSGTAVLFRVGAGISKWHSLKRGREENGLTISGESGKALLTLDYADNVSQVRGRVLPTYCP